jgi:hypothetical protein
MAPAFTAQYALEQALEERKRAADADAECLVNIEKAKHWVIKRYVSSIMYFWVPVNNL